MANRKKKTIKPPSCVGLKDGAVKKHGRKRKMDAGKVEIASSQSSTRSQSSTDLTPLDDESSFEEDLPEMSSVFSTPTQPSTKVPFQRDDLVWVKYKSWPFWPAVVRHVYNKKTVGAKLSLYFIGFPMLEMKGRGFTRSFDKHKVLPYPGNRYTELAACCKEHPDLPEAIRKADNFIRKRALEIITEPALKFLAPEIDGDNLGEDIIDDNASEETEPLVPEIESDEEEISESNCELVISLSASVQKSVDRRTAVNQKLVDTAVSDRMKAHLHDIFLSKKSSARHKTFLEDRVSLKKCGTFGPLTDDEQIGVLTGTLMKWYKEWQPGKVKVEATSYVMDVMVPEALIESLRICKRCSSKKAEEVMYKGARVFKEEHEMHHRLLLHQAQSIDPDDRERYAARQERMARDLLQGRQCVL